MFHYFAFLNDLFSDLNAQELLFLISGLDTEVILQNIKSVKVLKTILKNINYNVEVLNIRKINLIQDFLMEI
ncbi:hypothetical protein RCL_jg19008.t1 [Rhizophagus clarus]|uniref:Uncharacterized protein n=1 Tax=Rhizophagus clarus TaxID=94130 RepID=A0A8H3QX81_9GLOM|nr:hypothetical protein RCL_jg19008.t1 [Rhizophagus clarus]